MIPAHGYEAVYRKKRAHLDDGVRRLPVNAWNEAGEALVADPRGFLATAADLVVDGYPFSEVAPAYPGPTEAWVAVRALTEQLMALQLTIQVSNRLRQDGR